MAHHTQFRLFIGYSDPEAKEVGRVYQACNFMFLGHDYGTTVLYCDPERPDEWFTDRHVRHRTAYQKYAAEAGIHVMYITFQPMREVFKNMFKAGVFGPFSDRPGEPSQ